MLTRMESPILLNLWGLQKFRERKVSNFTKWLQWMVWLITKWLPWEIITKGWEIPEHLGQPLPNGCIPKSDVFWITSCCSEVKENYSQVKERLIFFCFEEEARNTLVGISLHMATMLRSHWMRWAILSLNIRSSGDGSDQDVLSFLFLITSLAIQTGLVLGTLCLDNLWTWGCLVLYPSNLDFHPRKVYKIDSCNSLHFYCQSPNVLLNFQAFFILAEQRKHFTASAGWCICLLFSHSLFWRGMWCVRIPGNYFWHYTVTIFLFETWGSLT